MALFVVVVVVVVVVVLLEPRTNISGGKFSRFGKFNIVVAAVVVPLLR